MANSIKHIRSKPEEQVTIESVLIFEGKKGGFRFIRNSIIAQYDKKNENFDAIDRMSKTIEKYFPFVEFTIDHTPILESNYPQYPWAIAYQSLELAALTKATRIITVKKEGHNYIRFDPKEIKFLVLDANLIGKDPSPYFPKV